MASAGVKLIMKAVRIGAARSVVGTYSAVDAAAPEDLQKTPVPRQQSGGPALDRYAVDFCEWCSDFAEHPMCCRKCHGKACTARAAGQSGCLRSDTIPKGDEFYCPDCSAGTHKVSQSFFFNTYSHRDPDSIGGMPTIMAELTQKSSGLSHWLL
jgi:hypothetical protein